MSIAKTNVTRTLELIGALGVIASIIYLGIEVRLSTKVAKAELTKDLVLASRQAIMDISADEELTQVWADIGNFDSIDAARKWTFYQSFFRLYELEYNLSKQGMVDESISNSYLLVIKMFGATKDFDAFWERARPTYDSEFAAFVDKAIAED